MCMCIYIYIHTYISVHICLSKYIDIYIYIYIYTHMYMQSLLGDTRLEKAWGVGDPELKKHPIQEVGVLNMSQT